MTLRVLTIIGTRPEAIKMVPVIRALALEPEIEALVCVTNQHKEMLSQVLDLFSIPVDFNLDVMRPGQELPLLIARLLSGLQDVIALGKPDLVLVQGDTSSCLAGALAAFYNQVPIAHIEAGLRTANLSAPFPEEAHRQMVSRIAALHFAPTPQAAEHLLFENVNPKSIHLTGNTIVDMVRLTQLRLHEIPDNQFINNLGQTLVDRIRGKKSSVVLITLHRRELSGAKFSRICESILIAATSHPEWTFIYPVHLNPDVRKPAYQLLSGASNIFLLEPQDYLTFIWLILNCDLVITDSGGVQEEAEILGKPLMIVRDHTDRPESLGRNEVRLTGTGAEQFAVHLGDMLKQVIKNRNEPVCNTVITSSFGDGHAAQKIVSIIKQQYGLAETPAIFVPDIQS